MRAGSAHRNVKVGAPRLSYLDLRKLKILFPVQLLICISLFIHPGCQELTASHHVNARAVGDLAGEMKRIGKGSSFNCSMGFQCFPIPALFLLLTLVLESLRTKHKMEVAQFVVSLQNNSSCRFNLAKAQASSNGGCF